jgi:hypothetical protein
MSILLLGAGKGGAGAALAPIVITSSATFSVAEDSTAVATLTASGGLGSYTWTKIGGADTAKFTLTSGGVLTFASAPDFDAPGDADVNNIYLVQVQAGDGISTPATQTISVTVTDVDLDFATTLSASRAGIGSAVVAEDHTGKTRII